MSLAYIQPILLTPAAAGGTVKLFLAGSTDQAPTYSPVTGEVSYSPLSIDSAGYCAAFTVDSTNTYDLKVYKANGSLYITRENLSVVGGGSGAVGPQGPQGIRGPAGATGATGAAGAAGINGTNGTDGEDGTDGVSLVSIRVDETTNTGKILYSLSSDPNNWVDAGDIVPAGLGQVKVGSADSLGFVGEKVVAGTDISIDNSGTQLTINNSAPETFKTQASQYSTVKDFLNAIIEGTSGITVTTSANFNKVVISGAGIGGSGFEPKGAWTSGTTYSEGEGVWYYDDSVSPVINRYYVATTTTTSNPYTDGTGWVIMFSIDQLGDQMVKLDAADSTTGFLLSKLVAGQGITFTRTVNAGGDFITINGTPVFSVGVNGTDKTISELANFVDLVDGEVTEAVWDGNTIKVNHDTYAESGTSTTQTATGLPKFDAYGHYKGASDAIEIGDVTGLGGAIAAAGDGKVAIETGDAKGYMIDKLSATGAVNMEISGTIGNEIMTVVGTGKIACEAYDAVGYAEDKIIAGSNIRVAKVDGPRGKALAISADFTEFDSSYPIAVQYGYYSGHGIDKDSAPKIIGKTSDFSLPVKGIDLEYTFNAPTGVFYPQKSGFYILNFRGTLEPSVYQTPDYDASVILKVETSYDGVNWSSYGGGENSQSYSVRWNTNFNIRSFHRTIAYNIIVDMRDNALTGNHRRCRLVLTHDTAPSGYNNTVLIRNPSLSFAELKRPQGIQGPQGPAGPQGIKGDKGDPGTAGEATLDGLLTFPIILSNTSISTGHTSDQGATYASSRVIAAASVEANYMSCFFTQVSTFYGLRMGIYTPGPAGDTLIAQTEVCTDIPSLGICTLPLTRDGAGNLLTGTLYLDPNTSYMPAVALKANATNLAAYTGISTNQPNHFGRQDGWNALAPTNLMPLTAAFSQSNTFPWLAISK